MIAHALAPTPPVQKSTSIETVSFFIAPNGKVLAAPRNAKGESEWIEAYGEPYIGTVPRRDPDKRPCAVAPRDRDMAFAIKVQVVD